MTKNIPGFPVLVNAALPTASNAENAKKHVPSISKSENILKKQQKPLNKNFEHGKYFRAHFYFLLKNKMKGANIKSNKSVCPDTKGERNHGKICS
jgi:hypothetical protein